MPRRPQDRRTFGLAGAASVLVLGLCSSACPGASKDPVPEPDNKANAAENTEALVRRANTEAFERLLPVAANAFASESPLASPSVVLAVPPVSVGRLSELRELVDIALREDDGIQPDLLEPKQQALLLSIRFGLDRIRDGLARRQPWRTDPSWVIGHATAVVDRVARERAAGPCGSCATALEDLATEVTAAGMGLAACSPQAAHTAAAGLRDLERAVAELGDDRAAPFRPDPAPSADPVVASMHAAAERMHAVAVALDAKEESTATYDNPGPPAKSPDDVRRLPSTLGKDELRRRFEVEENLSTPPGPLYGSLGPSLAQLGKLVDDRKSLPPQASATPFDLDRCSRLRAKLDSFAAAAPERPPVARSCEEILPLLPAQGTDAALLLGIIDRAMIDPYREQRRASEGPVLAVLSGQVAPRSGRHTFRLGIAMSYRDDHVTLLAAQDAWDDACMAAAAVWIHGELGPETELQEQLASRCGQRPADHWIGLARGNPRRALEGVAIGWLTRGPASVVLLERLWWLPLGLLGPLSDPSLLHPPQTPVTVDVEQLDGAHAPPSSSAPEGP